METCLLISMRKHPGDTYIECTFLKKSYLIFPLHIVMRQDGNFKDKEVEDVGKVTAIKY